MSTFDTVTYVSIIALSKMFDKYLDQSVVILTIFILAHLETCP